MTLAEVKSWGDYAEVEKKCFLKPLVGFLQATRYEAAKPYQEWTLFLPNPHGTVCVKDIEQAREVAARYGCEVIL